MRSRILTISIVVIVLSQFLTGVTPPALLYPVKAQDIDTPSAQDYEKPDRQKEEAEIEAAILSAIATEKYGWGDDEFQLRLDNLETSSRGDWAKAWIVYFDPAIEAVIPTEPGLAIAHLVEGEWQVFLPGEPAWASIIDEVPDGLISVAEREAWYAESTGSLPEFSEESLSGYNLPWIQGSTVNLSRSVSHDEDFTKAHYAFDFYIYKQMWPIYAARSGYVYTFRDDVPNDNHDEVNFLVLQNEDNPDLYQLYLHLAQYSIPPELKTVGAHVIQGQYIATADNTGISTGHHLHFQVEVQPNWPVDNPYWNQSVDIQFDEVDIYGGRPRREWEYDPEFCGGYCVDGRGPYVSDNEPVGDFTPPYGNLSGVTTGDILTSPILELSGWGTDDDSGLDYGQLVANYEGTWHELGEPFNPSFDYTWDMCAENAVVPDGAVSVALLLYDQVGNWEPVAGLSHFTKDYKCPQPPPACVPSADQVTLFEGIDYSGDCAKLDIGEYPAGTNLGAVGGDNTASIMVGAQVAATLYSENTYLGHSETLEANDSYLFDNLIGENTLSSLKLHSLSQTPFAPTLIAPSVEEVFEDGDVIPLSWLNSQGSTQYEINLTNNLGAQQETLTTFVQNEPFLLVENLVQGNYVWKVRGINSMGTSPWSQEWSFSIGAASPPPATVPVPFNDGFESNQEQWTGTGEWILLDNSGVEDSFAWWYRGDDGDYADGTPNFGSLTSPPINVNGDGYYLRFKYRYETENRNRWWDQRWVQISVNGEPFTNIYQLSEDPLIPELQLTTWLNSPALDLSAYAGNVIRIRFVFATLDNALNAFDGWGIDEISVTDTAPPSCSDTGDDDTPEQATPMVYDPDISIQGEICPSGDWDFYTFNGSQGDRIVVDIDASEDGSTLDPYLILYDSDGISVLSEDDDEVLGERRDPLLGYTLQHAGTYYLKLRAWNHPSVGGSSYDYQIRLFTDSDDPNTAISFPASGQYLPDGIFTIEAQATDPTDRISKVEFYWHSANWQIAPWTSLGTDWDGTDGWSMDFDPSSQPEGTGAAVYVIAYDRAGNLSGAVSWNLGIDKIAPYTSLNDLNDIQYSNAFPLKWTGSDNLSGINYYEIQKQLEGGTWQNDPGIIAGNLNQTWMIVDSGFLYGFRMRGTDLSGNVEDYPSTAEIIVTVPEADILCETLDIYDSDGNDNSPAGANAISAGGSQVHNFCNPLSAGFQNDQDWASFEAQSGQHYSIGVIPRSDQTAVVLSLFASDGVTLITSVTPAGFGRSTNLEWVSDRTGTVYLQMVHLDERVIGSIVEYQLLMRDDYSIFLPWVNR